MATRKKPVKPEPNDELLTAKPSPADDYRANWLAASAPVKKNFLEMSIWNEEGEQFTYENDLTTFDFRQTPNPACPFVYKLELKCDVKNLGKAEPAEKWKEQQTKFPGVYKPGPFTWK